MSDNPEPAPQPQAREATPEELAMSQELQRNSMLKTDWSGKGNPSKLPKTTLKE